LYSSAIRKALIAAADESAGKGPVAPPVVELELVLVPVVLVPVVLVPVVLVPVVLVEVLAPVLVESVPESPPLSPQPTARASPVPTTIK
jgi:hypothetical protein